MWKKNPRYSGPIRRPEMCFIGFISEKAKIEPIEGMDIRYKGMMYV